MIVDELTLEELGSVSRGRSRHRPRDAQFLYGGSYPFIQTGDVKRTNFYVTDYTQTYSDAGLAQSKLWRKGTLCITIAANIAEVAILGIDACFPDSIIGFIADEKRCDVRYIKYWFDVYKRRFKQVSQGAAQDNLSQQKLLTFKIPAPKVEVQKRIADVLYSYDNLIENNRRRIALLEEAAQQLYKEWFIRLRFPGHENTKIIDGVPEGWEKKEMIKICELVMGQSPKSEFYNDTGEGLPFHQGVTNFGERFVTHEKYCTILNRIAEPGDILCSVRAPVGRLNLTTDRIVIGRGLSAIRNRSGFQSFQYYQLKSHFHKEDMIGSGAIFASVTKKQMQSQLLLSPKWQVIEAFEKITNPIDRQIENLHHQNERLTEARDLLLPRLMSGEIEV